MACNEYNVHKVVDFLNKFLHISGLELNSQKSMAFRYGTSNFKPRWLQKHKWTWATDTVSNLLGTEFGLNLDFNDVDGFLIEKIQKKIRFWNTVHLPLVERGSHC